MNDKQLLEILENLPTSPGVYLMKGLKGQIVYVGKAKNLRNRVRQYFASSLHDTRFFVQNLQNRLSTIETIITNTDKEAILLEYNLIQRHLPRYNVRLTDDKKFLCLRIDANATWPRIQLVRRPKNDQALYFGPYHNAQSARETVKLINRHFKLRSCSDTFFKNRVRPCLQHQIKRCYAPCTLPVDPNEYAEQLSYVILFLKGKREDLVQSLEQQMIAASEALSFEKAAILRDQINAVKDALSPQRITELATVDIDLVAVYREGDLVCIVLMEIISGRIAGSRDYFFKDQQFPTNEILSSFLFQQYQDAFRIPEEILLSDAIDDADELAELLSDKKDRKVHIKVPQRGKRAEQIEMAKANAKHSFARHFTRMEDMESRLKFIQNKLKLNSLPRRIECVDIAHMGGQNTVAGISAVEDTQLNKAAGRKYNIKRATEGDDYAAMEEVLRRRFTRAKNKEQGWEAPDLLVVDGGRGQLKIATTILEELEMPEQQVISLAKERAETYGAETDRIFLPGRMNPIPLRAETSPLYALAMARDEAHRLANSFQAKKHRQSTIRSQLSNIDGVGPAMQRKLLNKFGSLKRIKQASISELKETPGVGQKLAEKIHSQLHPTRDNS